MAGSLPPLMARPLRKYFFVASLGKIIISELLGNTHVAKHKTTPLSYSLFPKTDPFAFYYILYNTIPVDSQNCS